LHGGIHQYPLGETRVQREAEALLRAGYAVDVICKRHPGEPAVDTYKGVVIHRLKFHFPAPRSKAESLRQKLLDPDSTSPIQSNCGI